MQTPKEITKRLSVLHGLAANQGMRNAVEVEYYDFHKIYSGAGKTLRAKYRPVQDR